MEKKRYIKPRSVVIGQDEMCPLMAASGDNKRMVVDQVRVDCVATQSGYDLSTSNIDQYFGYAVDENYVNPSAKMHDLWEEW